MQKGTITLPKVKIKSTLSSEFRFSFTINKMQVSNITITDTSLSVGIW
jgi:hypothetical protein